MKPKSFFLLILLLQCCYIQAQTDTARVEHRQKVRRSVAILSASAGAAYGMTLAGLNSLWYKNQPRSSFHFFDDNREWKQVDKTGHFYSSFYLSRIGYQAFRKTGMRDKAALWIGGSAGAVFMTPIEILDGFSAAYGASWGDLVANVSGSALLIGQQLAWNEVRIYPKYSFHPTTFAAQRPNTLGSRLHEQMLKDYNGHTYWLCVNLHAFLRNEQGRSVFPKWLNIAVGYGATNMLYSADWKNEQVGLSPYRRWFLAPDLNLSGIHTKKKWVRTLLFFADMIHLPAPALEYNRRKGWVVHGIYW